MEEKRQIQTRLKKIEGQIKGIEKMIENDMCCKDVLIQIAAVRAAVNKVGGMMIQNYAKTCLLDEGDTKCKSDEIESLVSTLTMFLK